MGTRFDFGGRHAIITGGASGIGFGTAKAFLEAGATVSLWDQDEAGLERTQRELGAWRDEVELVLCDVTDEASCRRAASLGRRPDVLINNAGITRDRTFAKMSAAEFRHVVDVNLTGVFLVTKAVLPLLPEASQASIVNIASVVAHHGNFGQCNYVAAKAGVIGFTKTLARELGPKGIRVNAVAPGFTRTPMVDAMPPAVLTTLAAKVPVGRLGTVDDIAHACLFLSAAESQYIHGAVLNVDGGLIV